VCAHKPMSTPAHTSTNINTPVLMNRGNDANCYFQVRSESHRVISTLQYVVLFSESTFPGSALTAHTHRRCCSTPALYCAVLQSDASTSCMFQEVQLSHFTDNSMYSRTITKLEIFCPARVIYPVRAPRPCVCAPVCSSYHVPHAHSRSSCFLSRTPFHCMFQIWKHRRIHRGGKGLSTLDV
jgi:hypothetical protein